MVLAFDVTDPPAHRPTSRSSPPLLSVDRSPVTSTVLVSSFGAKSRHEDESLSQKEAGDYNTDGGIQVVVQDSRDLYYRFISQIWLPCICFVFSILRKLKKVKKSIGQILAINEGLKKCDVITKYIWAELLLLGLISLLLGQCARWISQICVDSSLFSSKLYQCSNGDYETTATTTGRSSTSFLLRFLLTSENETLVSQGISFPVSHSCGEGRELFVSYEGLEQLHRFLFVLGIIHVLYSFLAVGLAMSKIYNWRKWEIQAPYVNSNLQAENKVLRRQSTFALHHASHPWSRSRVLIWMAIL